MKFQEEQNICRQNLHRKWPPTPWCTASLATWKEPHELSSTILTDIRWAAIAGLLVVDICLEVTDYLHLLLITQVNRQNAQFRPYYGNNAPSGFIQHYYLTCITCSTCLIRLTHGIAVSIIFIQSLCWLQLSGGFPQSQPASLHLRELICEYTYTHTDHIGSSSGIPSLTGSVHLLARSDVFIFFICASLWHCSTGSPFVGSISVYDIVWYNKRYH